MIIFGTTSRTKTESSGEFHCPNCAVRKPYRLRVLEKRGHIYWIPLFPMGEVARYVECDHCSKTYDEAVLTYDPAQESNKTNAQLATAVMAVAYVAAGQPELTSAFRQSLVALPAQLMNTATDDASVSNMIESGASDPNKVLSWCAWLAPQLTDRGKEIVLKGAVMGARLNPMGQAQAKAYIISVGQTLGMSSAHINGVLAEVASGN